jgi:hypothetical protein
MTIKEAVLKSLDDIKSPATYLEVYNHIVKKKYYTFSNITKTPNSTVSAFLGDFIRDGDTRVKRIKLAGGSYSYYLTKNEENINIDVLAIDTDTLANKSTDKSKTYEERDLHKLLCSFIKSTGIYSKTIFHEQSLNIKDSNQIWTHPDIVGIKFLKLHTNIGHNLIKAVDKAETFKLYSYEIKKEINSDNDLKKAYFQAVSNSSWANYGFLVAFEINKSLLEEMERLNQAFGIGIIELKGDPYKSRILYQPKLRDLDYNTIDKLCKINPDFLKFIEQIEKYITADNRYLTAIEKEFNEFCDSDFSNESERIEFCLQKKIPFTENKEIENS